MRLIPEKGDRRGEPSFPAYRVSHWGGASFDYVRKRFSGFYRFYGFSGEGAAHFVILSGEKRRMLENGLSKTGELSRRI